MFRAIPDGETLADFMEEEALINSIDKEVQIKKLRVKDAFDDMMNSEDELMEEIKQEFMDVVDEELDDDLLD